MATREKLLFERSLILILFVFEIDLSEMSEKFCKRMLQITP